MRRHRSCHAPIQPKTVTEALNAFYWTVPNYYGSCLSARCKGYNDDMASQIPKMTRRLELELELKMLDCSDPIRIFHFLPTSQLACNTNCTHTGVSMSLFHFFMNNIAKTALNPRTCLTISSCTAQEMKLMSPCTVLIFLLATYETAATIA